MNTHSPFPDRSQWLRYWSALPEDFLCEAAAQISDRYVVEDLELVQPGLGLLPLTDSALGDAYYIGEVPLSRTHVRLQDQSGEYAEGAAILMDDRTAVVRALAILDAICASSWPGAEDARALLQQGKQLVAKECRARSAILSATRVDFSLLGSTEEHDDE